MNSMSFFMCSGLGVRSLVPGGTWGQLPCPKFLKWDKVPDPMSLPCPKFLNWDMVPDPTSLPCPKFLNWDMVLDPMSLPCPKFLKWDKVPDPMSLASFGSLVENRSSYFFY